MDDLGLQYPTVFLSQSHKTFLAALGAADSSKASLGSIATSIGFGAKTVNRLLAPLLSVGAIEVADNSIGYAVTSAGMSLV